MPQFLALTSAGIEPLLADELSALGATEVVPKVQSVQFSSTFEQAMNICLWTRLSTRVLKLVVSSSGNRKDDIYDAVFGFDWDPYFMKTKSFLVEFIGTDKSIRNSQFGALTIKDAIVDNLREETGKRPDVDKSDPDFRVQGRLFKGKCDVYVDMSGPSLHQRGYRLKQGAAPLKEHLAAAVIKRSGWDKKSPFVDLFSGSGTLLIEAACMHINRAPGLNKHGFPFMKHPQFIESKYQEIRQNALLAEVEPSTEFLGFDIDGFVIGKAKENIDRANLKDVIKIGQQSAANVQLGKLTTPGWIVSNPPYGERIGDSVELLSLFKNMGLNLKKHFEGWHLSLLSGQGLLLKLLRLRKDKEYKLKNGPLDTVLVNYELTPQQCEVNDKAGNFLSKDGQAFAGRIDKNLKRLSKWVKRENITAYRIYDADIPEYNVAVDYYDGRVVVFEYQAPKNVNQTQAELRLMDVVTILQEKFGLDGDKFALKVRKAQKGKQQYEKEDSKLKRFSVEEYGAKFHINIHDYLDTGLFLDHRAVRQEFVKDCDGKTVLNLFCYTGSLSVHAALRGAKRVTSVDMSKTYLDWAQDNFRLNKLELRKHNFIRDDVLAWLASNTQTFDMIFLDPPSFSNSKRMSRTWDVQRDYLEVLGMAKNSLSPGGKILFSNNLRGFKLDNDAVSKLGFSVKDITKATLPEDFQRNAKIHQCWWLQLT